MRNLFAYIGLLGAAACGGSTVTPPAPAPAPVRPPASVVVTPVRPTPAPPLPTIPLVDGPLAIHVQYPSVNQVITSRDSNFIFGSIGSGSATLTINGVPARVYPNGAFMGWLANPPASAPEYLLVASRGADTVRATQVIRYPAPRVAVVPPLERKPENQATSRADTIAALAARVDSLRTQLARNEPLGYVMLGTPSAATDTDNTIVGRPTPGGTYKWFFTPGTIVPMMGREGGFVRVRLDEDLDVWVQASDAHEVSANAPQRHMTSNMRVRRSADGADVVIPSIGRAPYFVEELPRAIRVTLYGVVGNTDLVNYASADTMVRTVEWLQVGAHRAQVTINLREDPYGYLVVPDGNSMVVKLRQRPVIDRAHPLAGLTIAVDPGHPPIGATGPTGLWEPRATLPIGVRLQRMLEERGARVVMTRTTDSAVALEERPIIARKANVNAFVSIHLNAYPDGVNPFLHPGSGAYFFRTHSEPLARDALRGMVAQMGLEDLGVNYDNLAVVRSTWYPAILCEGAFVILPDQEAALRTPEFQERYARGVADGIEQYFRQLAP